MTKRSVPRRKAKSSPSKSAKRRKRDKFIEIGQFQYPVVDGLVEIEGHKLNPRQAELFRQKYDERLQIADRPGSDIRHPSQYARQLALSDLLWQYRPTAKAEKRLLDLSENLRKVTMQIGDLREFSFYSDGFATQEGSVFLLRLVQEAERRLLRIKHFASSMATERKTKLQDWTKREAEFEQLGEVQSS
jgi:hypothetical protein